MTRLPTIFLSHGAPDVVLSDAPVLAFWSKLASSLSKVRAILVASAHWETREPAVDVSRSPKTIHDFGGFPDELYRRRYAAPGAVDVAERAAELLAAAGFAPAREVRGLDHGAWIPLSVAWPAADVPVAQVALQTERGAAHHLELGRALAPLADESVLIVGSGSATHNLRALSRAATPPREAAEFDLWLEARAREGDLDALVGYRTVAPFASWNHPTEEHYFPLLAALGAAGSGARGETLHASFTYGSLSMRALRFERN